MSDKEEVVAAIHRFVDENAAKGAPYLAARLVQLGANALIKMKKDAAEEIGKILMILVLAEVEAAKETNRSNTNPFFDLEDFLNEYK